MEISKNLIFFKKREYFDRDFETISPTKICFIEDTKEVYTKGVFFDGSKVDLSNIEASIQDIINNKQDNISDLEVIRNGAALGATAVQPEVITQFQNTLLSGPIQSLNNKTILLENNKADKTELPTKTSELKNDSKYLNWQTVEQEIETARSIIGNCNLIEVDSQPLDLPINNEILLDTNNNILYIGIKNKMWWVIDNLKPFNPLIPDAKVIGTTLDVQGKVIDNILYTDSLNVQYNII